MRKRFFVLIVFLALQFVLIHTAFSADLAVRPHPKGEPTQVKIGIYVNDISKIDNVSQTFTADLFAVAEWEDPRLAGSSTTQIVNLNEVWHPQLRLLNRRALEMIDEPVVMVDPDGNVFFHMRVFGEFGLHLDLNEFPIDQHTLPLVIVSTGYGPEEVKLVIDENVTGHSKKLSIADWVIGDQNVQVSDFFFEPQKTSFSQLTYSLLAKRRAGFYTWRIIAPLVLIVFMSWMVFWIDPSHLEAQVGISATSVLTLVAFQFAVGHLLPRIAYLTRMDLFIVSTSVMVFLALVEGVTTSALTSHGKRELALKFDKVSRFIFPIAFILILVFSFWL